MRKIFEKILNIDFRTFNLCNNVQGFEMWFGANKYNNIDGDSLTPIKLTREWELIIDADGLKSPEKFNYYDIRQIDVSGIKENTRIQFMTSDSEIFERLVRKDDDYIIDVEPLKKGVTLNARYVSENTQDVKLFISIIRI